MNIKQLKHLIKNLPDEMSVVECREGNIANWTQEPDISVRTVYKFTAVRNYGSSKGGHYGVESHQLYKANMVSVDSEYEALVFVTKE